MESKSKYVIDFVELGVPVRRYNGSTPTLVFAACLTEFRNAHEAGKLNSADPVKLKRVLDAQSEYDAGKAAYFLLKTDAPFTLNIY